MRLGEAVIADRIVIAKNGALDAARGRRCAPAVEVYSALVISFSGAEIDEERRSVKSNTRQASSMGQMFDAARARLVQYGLLVFDTKHAFWTRHRGLS